MNLPSNIEPKCAAGDNPQLSHTRLGWVIHPADYDPDAITENDLLHDAALRRLTSSEEDMLDDV